MHRHPGHGVKPLMQALRHRCDPRLQHAPNCIQESRAGIPDTYAGVLEGGSGLGTNGIKHNQLWYRGHGHSQKRRLERWPRRRCSPLHDPLDEPSNPQLPEHAYICSRKEVPALNTLQCCISVSSAQDPRFLQQVKKVQIKPPADILVGLVHLTSPGTTATPTLCSDTKRGFGQPG